MCITLFDVDIIVVGDIPYSYRMADRSKALVTITLFESVGSRPTHGSIFLLLNVNDSLQVQV